MNGRGHTYRGERYEHYADKVVKSASSKQLLAALENGTVEQIKEAVTACHVAAKESTGVYSDLHTPAQLFSLDPQFIQASAKRLATAKTWSEFDDFYAALKQEVPYVLTDFYATSERASGPTTLAGSVLKHAVLNHTDAHRIKAMLVKFKNDGADLDFAATDLPATKAGNAIHEYIQNAGKAAAIA